MMLNTITKSQGCCCGCADFSIPIFGIGALIALVHGIYSIFTAGTLIIVSFCVLLATEVVAIWRVQVLGQAKKIAESIIDFEEENDRLKCTVDDLGQTENMLRDDLEQLNEDLISRRKTERKLQNNIEKQDVLLEKQDALLENQEELLTTQKENIENYEVMLGLFGDKVGDIDKVRKQLSDLVKEYKFQNHRQEANTLITLFGLIDRNNDGTLSQDEIIEMNSYIKIAYGEAYDFSRLDTDLSGDISLEEFFERFRNRDST